MALDYLWSADALGTGCLISVSGGNASCPANDGGGIALANAGWTVTGYGSEPYAKIEVKADHPASLATYGGAGYALKQTSNHNWAQRGGQAYSPNPTFTARSDGIVQFHLYLDGWGGDDAYDRNFFALLAGATEVLNLRFNGSGQVVIITGGVARYTTSWSISNGAWHTLAVRFKNGSSGQVQLNLDGGAQTYDSAVEDQGTTLDWDRMKLRGGSSNDPRWFGQISAWTDAADDGLTKQIWVVCARPTSDAADGSFTKSTDGNNTNLYTMADEAVLDTTDYCLTSTNPDEVRFGTDLDAQVSAVWSPNVIYGVATSVVVTGEGTLNSARTVIESAGDKAYGAATSTTTNPAQIADKVATTNPDTGAAWTRANLDGASFGYEAS